MFLFDFLDFWGIISVMRNTIKNHKDFITPRDFPYAVMDWFSVHTKLAKYPDDARYGLTAAKRNFRYAVQRNRAKRLLRDWIAFANRYMCPDLDYIFFARPGILNDDVTRDAGRQAMVRALKDIRHRNDFRKNGYQKKPKTNSQNKSQNACDKTKKSNEK